MTILQKSLRTVIRTTQLYFDLLAELNIKTVEDLLFYYPRTHEDLSAVKKLAEVELETSTTFRGIINNLENSKTKNNKIITKGIFIDEDGNKAEMVWFNQRYLVNSLPQNIPVLVTGKLRFDYGMFKLTSPVVELIKEEQVHTGRVVPVYREHSRISSKWLREKMTKVIQYCDLLEENLPLEILKSEKLITKVQAVKNIHYPESIDLLKQAKERLAFEELFFIQQKTISFKKKWQDIEEKDRKMILMDVEFIKAFFKILPFELTQAQKVVLYEILKDLEKPYPMSRLVEGDVGSGKTVVVVAALLNVFKEGFQTAIMAPTEVLARQHFATISKMLKEFTNHEDYQKLMGDNSISTNKPLDLFQKFLNRREPRVEFFTGSVIGKKRKEVLEALASGEIDVIVGTNALIQDKVEFNRLGLAVVDEQHRFGVEQRQKLKDIGSPHYLNMTATPIPRSLAMTAYGDHDLSVINELPPGRKAIITRIVPEKDRFQVYNFMRDFINKGRQIYVICPLIDESDVLEVKSVLKEYQYLQENIFPEFKVGLMHGKLSTGEKEQVMQKFNQGNLNILVSTSVIEVGIDVPNATIMMIEGSDRFGLAQMHQFRGRVGRADHQSYCFLCTESSSPTVMKRLKYMEQFTDGFKLAEIDLQLRGPGEVYGFRQSGLPDLKIASLADTDMIKRVKEAMEKLMN